MLLESPPFLNPQQYLGAVMLLVALMFVLFSNYMEERLADGKSVIRLNTCKMSSEIEKKVGGIDDKHSSLLQSSYSGKVRTGSSNFLYFLENYKTTIMPVNIRNFHDVLYSVV